jgi:hypothetical protein
MAVFLGNHVTLTRQGHGSGDIVLFMFWLHNCTCVAVAFSLTGLLLNINCNAPHYGICCCRMKQFRRFTVLQWCPFVRLLAFTVCKECMLRTSLYVYSSSGFLSLLYYVCIQNWNRISPKVIILPLIISFTSKDVLTGYQRTTGKFSTSKTVKIIMLLV